MPENKAVWLTAKQAHPMEVKSAPYTPPGPDEIVVRSRAVATNPIDYVKQVMGDVLFGWIKYPFILGWDVAGEVVEVGSAVTRFHVGDRALGCAVGMDKRSKGAAESAFQHFVVLRDNCAAPIPDGMSFGKAAVLPICLATAACGLFQEDQLALRHPSPAGAEPTGETVVIWGASTAVGANAVQLARAAGYEVLATAGPKNHEYVRGLGAAQVFDYRSPTVVPDLIAALQGKKCAGAAAIGDGSTMPCIDIVAAATTPAGRRKWVAQFNVSAVPKEAPRGLVQWAGFIGAFAKFNASLKVKTTVKGVGAKFLNGSDVMANEVGEAIFRDYLPQALREGKHVPVPEPYVVGHGLEFVQQALDEHKQGVSAKKPVVTL